MIGRPAGCPTDSDHRPALPVLRFGKNARTVPTVLPSASRSGQAPNKFRRPSRPRGFNSYFSAECRPAYDEDELVFFCSRSLHAIVWSPHQSVVISGCQQRIRCRRPNSARRSAPADEARRRWFSWHDQPAPLRRLAHCPRRRAVNLRAFSLLRRARRVSSHAYWYRPGRRQLDRSNSADLRNLSRPRISRSSLFVCDMRVVPESVTDHVGSVSSISRALLRDAPRILSVELTLRAPRTLASNRLIRLLLLTHSYRVSRRIGSDTPFIIFAFLCVEALKSYFDIMNTTFLPLE